MVSRICSNTIFSKNCSEIDFPATIRGVLKVALPAIALAAAAAYVSPLVGLVVLLTGVTASLAYLIFCATIRSNPSSDSEPSSEIDANSSDEEYEKESSDEEDTIIRSGEQIAPEAPPLDFDFQGLERLVGPIEKLPVIEAPKCLGLADAETILHPISQGVDGKGARFLAFKLNVVGYYYKLAFTKDSWEFKVDRSRKPVLKGTFLEIVTETNIKGRRSICVTSQAYPQALASEWEELSTSVCTFDRPELLLERVEVLMKRKNPAVLRQGGILLFYSLAE